MNPLESLPEDTDSKYDSDWEEKDTCENGNAFDVFKDSKTYSAFLLLLIFDICFICFLSSYFCFLKSIPKLQFYSFCFTPSFLSPYSFLNFWIG